MSKKPLENRMERLLMYILASVLGMGAINTGTVYFQADAKATGLEFVEGLPKTTAVKNVPLNDDLVEDEKQYLWRIDKIQIFTVDTLGQKGQPKYISYDKAILQNEYIWTTTDTEPDKIYINSVIRTNPVTAKYHLVNFSDPVKVKQ